MEKKETFNGVSVARYIDLNMNEATYGIYGLYVSPLLFNDLVLDGVKLKKTYNKIIEYVKNSKISLSEDKIKKYLEQQINKNDPELKNRINKNAKLNSNPTILTDEDIKKEAQKFIDDIKFQKYKYEPYTLKYFNNYINILKEKILNLFNIIEIIQNINLNKYNSEKANDIIIFLSSEYDIKILNGNIYYKDIERIVNALVENILDLNDKLDKANNLETYLNFSISLDNIYRAGLSENDIYPFKNLQVNDPLMDQKGCIRLSENQIEKIKQEEDKHLSYILI